MKDAHTKYFSSSVHQDVFRGKLTGFQTALNSSIPVLFAQNRCLHEYLLIQLHTGSVCIVQLFCLVSLITNENRGTANNSKKLLFTHSPLSISKKDPVFVTNVLFYFYYSCMLCITELNLQQDTFKQHVCSLKPSMNFFL